jgi:hypothetical protein
MSKPAPEMLPLCSASVNKFSLTTYPSAVLMIRAPSFMAAEKDNRPDWHWLYDSTSLLAPSDQKDEVCLSAAMGAAKQMLFMSLKTDTHEMWYKDSDLRKNIWHCVGFYFAVFYLGFDASLMNGLQAIPQWQE